jgi:hypothetical protein
LFSALAQIADMRQLWCGFTSTRPIGATGAKPRAYLALVPEGAGVLGATMDALVGVLSGFTAAEWMDLAALLVTIVAGIYAAIRVHTERKQRKLDAARNEPGVGAIISRTPSIDGWRSIQLHLTPPPAAATFHYGERGWRIVNAKLLSPRDAKLAFARDDDHSLKGPIAGLAPRLMSGRTNHPQPFAMEFFIRFPGTPHADRGRRAKLRVRIGHSEDVDLHRTIVTWAEVPFDAETKRQQESS